MTKRTQGVIELLFGLALGIMVLAVLAFMVGILLHRVFT